MMIIGSDVLDYFKIGDEHIDMSEWRREKLHGKVKTKKKKKKVVPKTIIKNGNLV
jgi:hypothetical protein